MSFLGKILKRASSKTKEGKIVLLGSSGAGKTTLVRYLETGETVKEDAKTTLGIDIRQKPLILEGWSLKAIDVGGQELYQRVFWSLGAAQANAVIYVIDGTTKPGSLDATWETAQFQFEYMLNLIDKNIPLLILINKQDLKKLNPLTTVQAIALYHINKIRDRSFTVLPSSAKYGDGVQTALKWLVNKIESTKK